MIGPCICVKAEERKWVPCHRRMPAVTDGLRATEKHRASQLFGKTGQMLGIDRYIFA